MELNEYQNRSGATALYPDRGSGSKAARAYAALGLAGEAGEIANKVKKVLRGDDDAPPTHGSTDRKGPDESVVKYEARREQIKKELGDVLWYLAACAKEWGLSLEEVASANLAELSSRKSRGTLQGDGDDR